MYNTPDFVLVRTEPMQDDTDEELEDDETKFEYFLFSFGVCSTMCWSDIFRLIFEANLAKFKFKREDDLCGVIIPPKGELKAFTSLLELDADEEIAESSFVLEKKWFPHFHEKKNVDKKI